MDLIAITVYVKRYFFVFLFDAASKLLSGVLIYVNNTKADTCKWKFSQGINFN